MNYKTIWVVLVFMAAICLANAQSDDVVKLPIKRIITNNGGKAITASILAKYSKQIQIRIGENPKVHVLDLEQLSQDDQEFLNALAETPKNEWEQGLLPPVPQKTKIEVTSSLQRDEAGPKGGCRRYYRTYAVTARLTRGKDLGDQEGVVRLVVMRVGKNGKGITYRVSKKNSQVVTSESVQDIDLGEHEYWNFICRCCPDETKGYDFIAQVWQDGKLVCQSPVDFKLMDEEKIKKLDPP